MVFVQRGGKVLRAAYALTLTDLALATSACFRIT